MKKYTEHISKIYVIADVIKDDLDYIIEKDVKYDDFYIPEVTIDYIHNGICVIVEFNPAYVSTCELIGKLNSTICKYKEKSNFDVFLMMEDLVTLKTFIDLSDYEVLKDVYCNIILHK